MHSELLACSKEFMQSEHLACPDEFVQSEHAEFLLVQMIHAI